MSHKQIHPDTESLMQKVGTPTYETYRDLRNTDGSTGIISGGIITDGGAGTIDVTAIEFFVRSTNDNLGELLSANLGALTSQALTDNSLNYIYASYNGGTPSLSISPTPLADIVTNVILGVVYRGGTELHVTTVNIPTAQVEQQLSRRLTFVDGIVRQSGGVVSETGVLRMAITSGEFWLGLTEYNTPAIDTNVADTFRYYYQDGVGGFTEVNGSTDIDNLKYDDGSGTLATLADKQYGIHWVYRGLDGDTYVIYGTGSYKLNEAQNAPTPSSLPPQITIYHGVLLAKIIIKEEEVVFAEIQSAFETTFAQGLTSSHADLADLNVGDLIHLTALEKTKLDGIEALAEVNPTPSEIKTDYESNADTNVFDDASQTKLGNLFEGFLGYFTDETALTTAHAIGSNGQFANLGSTDTMWAWDADTTAWVNTGSASSGDMLKSTYDPTSLNVSAFDRANMTGTQLASTISDFESAVDALMGGGTELLTNSSFDTDVTGWTGGFLNGSPVVDITWVAGGKAKLDSLSGSAGKITMYQAVTVTPNTEYDWSINLDSAPYATRARIGLTGQPLSAEFGDLPLAVGANSGTFDSGANTTIYVGVYINFQSLNTPTVFNHISLAVSAGGHGVGTVTQHSDVSDAGSGLIITDTERTKLDNIMLASQQQGIVGEDNTTTMTPLRVKEAITNSLGGNSVLLNPDFDANVADWITGSLNDSPVVGLAWNVGGTCTMTITGGTGKPTMYQKMAVVPNTVYNWEVKQDDITAGVFAYIRIGEGGQPLLGGVLEQQLSAGANSGTINSGNNTTLYVGVYIDNVNVNTYAEFDYIRFTGTVAPTDHGTGTVTEHNDVSDAGSGLIITDAERTNLNSNTGKVGVTNEVPSDVTGISGSAQITNMVSISQSNYDLLTPNPSTLYVIV